MKIGGEVRLETDETPPPMIAVPVFGTASHIAIDRRCDFIQEVAVTSASAADGRQLRHLVTTENSSSEVWAGCRRSAIGPGDDGNVYRSRTNEKWLDTKGLTSRIHRREPAGNPMPEASGARAQGEVRVWIEHVVAQRKNRLGVLRACAFGAGTIHCHGLPHLQTLHRSV